MLYRRILPLFLICLLVVSKYVSMCPSEHGHLWEIHFITEPCGSHDCERTESTTSDESGNGHHELCEDASVTDACIVSSHQDYQPTPAQVIQNSIIEPLHPVLSTGAALPVTRPPNSPQRNVTCLRI